MVIHHDKMAYGRVDGLADSLSEDRLKEMAKRLSAGGKAQPEKEEGDKKEKKEGSQKRRFFSISQKNIPHEQLQIA